MAGEGEIKVYGAIRSMTGEGKVAYASQLYDEAQGKFQSQINQETANDGLVSAKVSQTFNDSEKEQARNNIGAIDKTAFYFSDINTSDITEGTLTGAVKTKLIALRSEASTAKLVMLQGGDTDVVATIESFGSTFQMWFVEKGRYCEVEADTSGNVWTAHWTTLYVKPSGGIPKTDLATGVQTSLGKADTAYQKPAGGIPDTDTAFAEAASEAIIGLYYDFIGLREMLKNNLGETKAECIDFHYIPKVCGQPLVIKGAGAPAVVPAFEGQRYHDTTNRKIYEAIAVTGRTADWVLLN